jgi:hypothetical protein
MRPVSLRWRAALDLPIGPLKMLSNGIGGLALIVFGE